MDNYGDNHIFQYFNTFIYNGFRLCYLILKPLIKVLFTVFIISFMHWGLIRIMSEYCTPPGFWGPFVNIITLGSPICQAINHLQLNISNYYVIVLGSILTIISNWIYNYFDITK